ncbi:MAG: purine-nucleoside phosphorylase [Bacilli bacterium]|nr:purine-nucleoside phosphorylase [Bacilli bacterium]
MLDWKINSEQAAEAIRKRIRVQPRVGIILGSGLGDLVNEIEQAVSIDYEEIPHFPKSTVEGHAGRLIIGLLQGQPVLAMQGRFHYYEGYSMKEVTFPVTVMKQLGIDTLIVTNAAGGMNPAFQAGDLMLIRDHINFTGAHPLIGPNIDEWGARFPDMSEAYSPDLAELMQKVAQRQGISLQQGVYVGISGPSYMTPAELKMLAKLGGDAVGMSTVPEVIVSNYLGMRTVGVSSITDMALGDQPASLSHEQVIEMANWTKPKFMSLIKSFIRELAEL